MAIDVIHIDRHRYERRCTMDGDIELEVRGECCGDGCC
jgi:hypothetical protein